MVRAGLEPVTSGFQVRRPNHSATLPPSLVCQKSGTRGDSRVCHWCSYHILTSSAIYYWTDAQQHGTYLFYIITKQITTHKALVNSKYSNITRKPAFAHFGKDQAIWRNLWSIQNEAISLVTMRSKQLRLVEKNHATVKPDSSVASREMKTYSESRIELRNLQILKKILEKSSQFFVFGAALWAEKLWRCLENCGSWKSTLRKLAVDQEAIWFEFWMNWKQRKWRWRFLSSVVGDFQIR